MNQQAKFIFPILLCIAYAFALNCPEAGTCGFVSEKRIKAYLLSLPDSLGGKGIKPFVYCDNVTIFKSEVFVERIIDRPNKRYIFVFARSSPFTTKSNERIAYVWVERNGRPIPFPDTTRARCRDCLAEGAHTLTGGSYMGDRVYANGCVTVLALVNDDWLAALRPAASRKR
jgi:hypothetical protein